MGLKSCQIVFDNAWNTYYAGQTINGRVEITVDTPKKVRGISICFKGEAHTGWTVEESKTNNEGNRENERIDFTGEEEYFKIQYYLIGGQGSGELELPIGTHIYPFTCLLPPTLPSSFEGEFGHVRYTVKVKLDRPWKFDHETKAAFTVLSPLDLNANPRLKEPIRVTLEKYFCCCWCKSGPLTCVISVPYSGFVPGQAIPVTAEVDNISNVQVNGLHLALKKIVSYHSQQPRKDSKKDIVLITEVKVGPVAAHASNTWNNPINVPPLPPSNLTNCSIIDLDYELEIEMDVAGFHTNLRSKIPITIGTVPLAMPPTPAAPPEDSTVLHINTENLNNVAVGQIGWVDSENKNCSYSMVPSFVQSQFGTKTIQDKNDGQHVRFNNDSQQYYPMYPVYSRDSE